MNELIPCMSTLPLDRALKNEYLKAFSSVVDSSFYVMGKHCEDFEKAFAAFSGCRYGIGTGNGLDALTVILLALGIGEGDEVIVPAHTFIATALAVTQVGATPVFAEPDLRTYNVNARSIADRIGPKTKAVIPVHLYGQPCPMDEIMALAKEAGLYVVEDCAQSHGASYRGKMTGSFGTAAAFSFYPTKNLGALGDGGAVVTDNGPLADAVRALRNYGSEVKYENRYLGINSRLDEVQAALLSVKLQHMEEVFQARKHIAKCYLEGIHQPNVILPYVLDGADPVWHIFAVRSAERDRLQKHLLECGIGTMVHYPIPPHLQECYRYLGYRKGDFPVAEDLAMTELSLPMYYGMSDAEIGRVIEAVNGF